MSSSKSELELLNEIKQDEFYKCFILEQTRSKLLESMTISEQVQKLGDGIDKLNKELQKQVLEKHEDLLQQANQATNLENILNTMNGHVQNLFANAERLKKQIHAPYEALERHTKVLGHLHKASHVLRQVNRIQQLSRKLGSTNDPVQKATILQELEQLTADDELKNIDVVTAELRNIRGQQQKVIQLATGSLNQGIINENVSQTTTALQIFINLGTINKVTQDFIENSTKECSDSLKTCFNISSTVKTTKGGTSNNGKSFGNSQGYRARVWSELEKVFYEEIYQQCKQIKFLQTTLYNINSSYSNLASEFWSKLSEIIRVEIKNSPAAIHQMLQEDYPKLLKFYYETVKNLKYEQFPFNREVLEKCENSYLSTTLTKLLEPTQEIFSAEKNIPTHDDIDKIMRIISSDLSVALIEENLSEKIAKNVAKCVQMFAVKAEQQIDAGPDSAQVIAGSPNLGQQKNVQLANSLYYFQIQVQRILSNMKESLTKSKIAIISESLKNLDNLQGNIIHPLTVSINSAVETIIETIQMETDWSKLDYTNRTIPCSLYIRELNDFLTRVFNTYLAHFENKEILTLKCKEIATRCIDLFIRHSVILRPISQGGRLRLQSDYNNLESTIRIIYPNLPDLGIPYKLLKSMTTLISSTPEEITQSFTTGSVVPHSIILLMLFSFAGAELASPHQNTGWSSKKLSVWLDEHTNEGDRLDLIAGAVQRYENLIRKKNSVNYDPVYPVISGFLEKALKNLKQSQM